MPDVAFAFSPSLASLLAISFGGLSVLGASLALGIRHGIDWDHIAAITDITSTTASQAEDSVLTREPTLYLTDESHHRREAGAVPDPSPALASGESARPDEQVAGSHTSRFSMWPAAATAGAVGGSAVATVSRDTSWSGRASSFTHRQWPSLFLGSMYALGHGSVVFVLGVLAILANEFLPGWIDPIMERVVGFTLLFLAVYLFYSLYRYFRGGEEFKLRSRWMLVFAAARNGWEAVRARIFGGDHEHVHEAQQYGVKTAYGIGLIHGIGAETGTQVLVITAAAGAGSSGMGLVALLFFIVGLLISNSIVTVMTTAGFASSRQRNAFYITAGFLAAVFSLVVGVVFLTRTTGFLPDLDPYFRWIGGPS